MAEADEFSNKRILRTFQEIHTIVEYEELDDEGKATIKRTTTEVLHRPSPEPLPTYPLGS